MEEDEGGQGLEERGRNWREDGCLGKCGVAGEKLRLSPEAQAFRLWWMVVLGKIIYYG